MAVEGEISRKDMRDDTPTTSPPPSATLLAADEWITHELCQEAIRDPYVKGPKQAIIYDTTLRGT